MYIKACVFKIMCVQYYICHTYLKYPCIAIIKYSKDYLYDDYLGVWIDLF